MTVVALTGCSKSRDTDKPTADKEKPRLEVQSPADKDRISTPQTIDSLRDDFVEHGLLVTDSRVEFAARFGQPDSIAERPVINRHIPSQTDSIADLFYPGLHLTYYVVGDGKKEFLQTAIVSHNRYLKHPEVGIGTSEATILRLLGDPSSHESGKYRYDCVRCIGAESPVYLHIQGGKVQRIEYTFYVD